MFTLPFEYAVRNLGRAPRRLIGGLLGSFLLVLLALGAGGFMRGMSADLAGGGSEFNVIILGAGSEESIERSEISAAVPGTLAAAVSGLKAQPGAAYVSPEVHVALAVSTAPDTASRHQAVFRAMTPAAFLVHPQVRITAGRAPQPGREELLVGELAHARLGLPPEQLAIGRKLYLDGRAWTIVGRFAAPGTVMNAELWTDLNDLMIATKRVTISCVIVTLDQAEFADVDAFCKQRLDLELTALRESEYYARLRAFYGPIRALVLVTAALAGLGGLFGGLNTMYAALAARVRELATLRTLGFSQPAIVLSLMQESLITASAGALLAIVIGLALLDGVAVRISMGAFGLRIDAPVVAISLALGLLLGIIGVLPPAWRCLRLPIPSALRAA